MDARENFVIDLAKNSTESLNTVIDQVTAALKDNFSQYTGVYIYLLVGDTLVLKCYRGRQTEHTRIPIGEGICGRAARVERRSR